MADINFTGNKQLKSINREWCTKFPYLYLQFYNANGKIAGDWTKTHASIRAKKDAAELLTTATMKVATFEKRYQETFGCQIEIKYSKNGRTYRSLNDHNEMTLSAFNQWAKDHGAAIIMEEHKELF